ncbi:MAG: hypothetical protein EP343_29820, partial [Deltaproteobacteria bacterium]
MNEDQLGMVLSEHPSRVTKTLTMVLFAALMSLGTFAILSVFDASEAQAQSLPTCSSSYYNYRRCSGNYRYRCTRRTEAYSQYYCWYELYYYYQRYSCGWLGWSTCYRRVAAYRRRCGYRTQYRYTYYWTLDSSSSSYYYCQYGCYNYSTQAYCRCPGGYSYGQYYCSGNYRYYCNATTYRYGSYSNQGYCQYGCYRSGNSAYCRCSGGYTANQYYCSGNYRARCNATTSRYGSVSTWYCQYGCYMSGSTPYCRCSGGYTANQQYCSGNNKYRCNATTSRYGSATYLGGCSYGCQMSGSTAVCRCRTRNGVYMNHGQYMCSNYLSSNSYYNNIYANYYSDRNGG